MHLVDLVNFFGAICRRKGFAAGPTVKEMADELGVAVPKLIEGCLLLKVACCGPELTQTHCYMALRDVPFLGWKCFKICIACNDETGGGCCLTLN